MRLPTGIAPRHGLPPPSATFYGRALRLRHTRLRAVVRVAYLEGAIAAGFVLYLADWASAWVILGLPAAIAVAVKIYDIVAVATPRVMRPEDLDGRGPETSGPADELLRRPTWRWWWWSRRES